MFNVLPERSAFVLFHSFFSLHDLQLPCTLMRSTFSTFFLDQKVIFKKFLGIYTVFDTF